MKSRRKDVSQEMCWKTSAFYITICCSENKTQTWENLKTLREIATMNRNTSGCLQNPNILPIYEWVNVGCNQPPWVVPRLASRAFLCELEILRTHCDECRKEHGEGQLEGSSQKKFWLHVPHKLLAISVRRNCCLYTMWKKNRQAYSKLHFLTKRLAAKYRLLQKIQ